jgi:type VI secretion system Hcp family effector
MKKLATLRAIVLVILLSITLSMGCQLPGILEPDTHPSVPETPSVDEEETTDPEMYSSAYLKFEGIDGEVQSEGHEGWSEIVSFEQAIFQLDSGSMGTARRRGEVYYEDIKVVKQLDKASIKLAEAISTGKLFPKVEIHLTGPTETSSCQGIFYIYELKNVMITSYKLSGSNPLAYALITPSPDITMPSSGPFIVQAVDAPLEEMSLKFEEIKVTYTECDSSGMAKGSVEYSWNVEEAAS